MSYENVSFKDLKPTRLTTVREKITELWADGFTAEEISKRVKVSVRSVATAMGNLTRTRTRSTVSRQTRTRS